MTKPPRSPVNSLPSDSASRDRLRDAQRRESEALRGYLGASRRVAAELSKRDKALAVYDAAIQRASELVDRALSDLVDTSGVERAAVLAGQPETVVRGAVKAHRRTDRAAADTTALR